MRAHLSQTPLRTATLSFQRTLKAWVWIAVAATAISYRLTIPAQAAETTAPDAKGGPSMEGMDHSDMDHSQMQDMDHDAMPDMKKPITKGDATKATDHSDMPGMKMPADNKDSMDMDMGAMQGGKAPPDARDPDAYAEGLKPGPMHGMDMADDALIGRLWLDKFEYAHSKDGNAQVLDAQAWYGEITTSCG